MILPLKPPIAIETPQGGGHALYLIEYGPEYDLYWITALDSTGECFTFNNRDIRARINIRLERQGPEQEKNSAA